MRNHLVCIITVVGSFVALSFARAEEPAQPTPVPLEAEAEQIIVSATRFDIPLDQSPATVTVIDSRDLATKQIKRVADALREVPGVSVVETGAPGQLTSVFTRGL